MGHDCVLYRAKKLPIEIHKDLVDNMCRGILPYDEYLEKLDYECLSYNRNMPDVYCVITPYIKERATKFNKQFYDATASVHLEKTQVEELIEIFWELFEVEADEEKKYILKDLEKDYPISLKELILEYVEDREPREPIEKLLEEYYFATEEIKNQRDKEQFISSLEEEVDILKNTSRDNFDYNWKDPYLYANRHKAVSSQRKIIIELTEILNTFDFENYYLCYEEDNLDI